MQVDESLKGRTTADILGGLRDEMAAVSAINYVRTPLMAFQDVVLRRKPSHKRTADEAFARHGPVLAALLAELVARDEASPPLASEIAVLLDLSRLREWATTKPAAELALAVIEQLPLPDPAGKLLSLPSSKVVGQALVLRMVGVGRKLLRQHGISVSG